MSDSTRLTELLSSFARILIGEQDLGALLYRLCDVGVEAAGATGAGILIEDVDGSLRYAVASDQTAARAEQLQLHTGEGPCMLAHQTGEKVLVANLEQEQRFPAFTPRALETGIRAVFTFPLRHGDRCVGVLDLYRDQPQMLDGQELQHAALLAEMAAVALLNRRSYDDSVAVTDRLQDALDIRIAMEQAKGRISEQAGVDPGVAEKMIYDAAKRGGEAIGSIVARIADGTLRMDQYQSEEESEAS
jgi:GAF domain-containing protein